MIRKVQKKEVQQTMANATETPDISELSQEELNARTQTMVGLPLGLRLAVRAFGASQEPKMSEAAVMRNGIAAYIGYELPQKAERVSKYNTPEEAKAANKARQKERRQKLQATLKRFSVPSAESVDDDDDDDEDDDEVATNQ
jgi:hypothetical protein